MTKQNDAMERSLRDAAIQLRISRETTVPLANHAIGLIIGRHNEGETVLEIHTRLINISGLDRETSAPGFITWVLDRLQHYRDHPELLTTKGAE